MDIEGFGEVVIDQLLKRNKLHTLADIYRLTYDDFIGLDLFKEKKANNLVESIIESKKRPLSKLLFALGIRHIGEKVSEIIAKRFKNIDAVFQADIKDFIKIYEIGDVLALSLKEFFENKTVRHIIDALISAGVNMVEPETQVKGVRLEDKVFVLTGELEKYTRNHASEIIKSLGGKVTSSISKKTDYLLIGANPGSKLKKVRELNIKIINEAEFEKLIGC
jgi:DNA ligase (NAD+)